MRSAAPSGVLTCCVLVGLPRRLEPESQHRGGQLKYSGVSKDVTAEGDLSDEMSDLGETDSVPLWYGETGGEEEFPGQRGERRRCLWEWSWRYKPEISGEYPRGKKKSC